MGLEWGSEPGDSSSCSLLPAPPPVQAVDGPRGIAFLGSTVCSQNGLCGRHTGPHFGRPKPASSSVTILLWNAPWQINKRQAAPLRTRVERAPGYILRAKNQVIEKYVKYDSVYKQIILKIIHTHMQPYYSIFPSIDWFYASIYDSFRVSREPEQASLMF